MAFMRESLADVNFFSAVFIFTLAIVTFFSARLDSSLALLALTFAAFALTTKALRSALITARCFSLTEVTAFLSVFWETRNTFWAVANILAAAFFSTVVFALMRTDVAVITFFSAVFITTLASVTFFSACLTAILATSIFPLAALAYTTKAFRATVTAILCLLLETTSAFWSALLATTKPLLAVAIFWDASVF